MVRQLQTLLRIGSGSVYYSESFIVKALDTAGNVSLQSNVLSTIYVSVQIDTCNKRVEIAWNSYSSVPKEVMDYRVYYSVNGGSSTDSIMTGPGTTNLVLEDFIVDAQYCFFVKASLTGGLRSGSNKACLLTKMQRPPEWINADYASVVNNHDIMLSFTPDPMSEIRSYVLEKKTGINGQFTQIYSFENISGRTQFIDDNADVSKVNFYRFNAINSCNKMVTLSNLASNIVLALNQDDEEINLSWNPYKTWRGLIDSNLVYIKTGQELEERYSLAPTDSAMVIEYSSLMYEVTQPEICFMIRAVEASNPYYANGETSSQVVCIPVTEKVTVPNMFTPDNNSVNDLFRPVLSFTPAQLQAVNH